MLCSDFDPDRKALINPEDHHSPLPGFPEICILPFSARIVQKCLASWGGEEIAGIHFCTGTVPVYRVEAGGTAVALAMPHVGAPAAASFLALPMRSPPEWSICAADKSDDAACAPRRNVLYCASDGAGGAVNLSKGCEQMEHIYHPRGVCSREMRVEVEDGIIRQVKVIGGCDGNLKGISKLLVGMRAEDAIEKLEGIRCGFKNTSCPDQLSKALRECLEKSSK